MKIRNGPFSQSKFLKDFWKTENALVEAVKS